MNNRKIILYIAVSLDGYIARGNNDIDWLSVVESPVEDYGYSKFIKTVDTVIMGRKTYDTVLSFGIAFPHRDKKCYVLSKSRKGKDENVEYYNEDIGELISMLRKIKGTNIFIDGGAEIVFELMKRNLIDEYVISIVPIFIGEGISLFKNGRPEQNLKLMNSITYPSGLVQLWYSKKSNS